MAGDRMGTGIIGSERQRGIAELLEHHQQVSRRAVEVLGDVMGIDAEIARSFRHQLAEPDGSRLWRDSVSGAPGDAQSLGMKLADGILAQGAKALLERLAH